MIEKVAERMIKFQNLFFGGFEGLIMELAAASIQSPSQRLENVVTAYSARWIAQILMQSINGRKIRLHERLSNSYRRCG